MANEEFRITITNHVELLTVRYSMWLGHKRISTHYMVDGAESSKEEYYKKMLDKHKGTERESELLAELLGEET